MWSMDHLKIDHVKKVKQVKQSENKLKISRHYQTHEMGYILQSRLVFCDTYSAHGWKITRGPTLTSGILEDIVKLSELFCAVLCMRVVHNDMHSAHTYEQC